MSAFPVIEDAFTGEVHPYASRWPMRSADELEEMAESIRSRRQRFPIVLTPDGVLVDGRNRLAACTLANVEPWFEMDPTLTSEEEIGAFIWDANGDRRDMSKGQKAMLAALRPGTAVLLSNTSEVARSFVAKARQVIEWCPAETVESVIGGHVSLNDAYADAQQIKATEQADEIAAKKAAAERKAQAERDARLLADLRDNRPDLATLVDEDRLPLPDALRLRADDIAKAAKRAEAKAAAVRQFNADLNVAFTSLDMLRHPERLQEAQDNWNPLVRPWTAADLHSLADLLHDIADQWRAT